MKKTFFIIMVMLAAFGCRAPHSQAQAPGQTGIVAHRGFWNCEEAGYAKNSIAALRCAQEAGFWGSEFDVRITSDSVLIVYHDKRINGKRIERQPYYEIKDITLENGEALPTLDMFLEQGKKYPETMLVVEFKPLTSEEADATLVNLTFETLKEQGLYDPERVMFISFGLHICEKIAAEHPQFKVQYLGSLKSPKKISRLGISGIDYNHRVLSICRKWADQARSLGMDVNAWTLNKESATRRMLEKGVDQITTDTPLLARDLMQQMNITEIR